MKYAFVVCLFLASVAHADAPIALPTEYVADRFYVTAVLLSGERFRCYTNTGTTGAFLFEDQTSRPGFPRKRHLEGGANGEKVPWPAFRADASIPSSLDRYLMLLDRDRQPFDENCLLGQGWFAGRVWTFDYPGQKLWLRSDLPTHDKANQVALMFTGHRDDMLARIDVIVDGEKLPMLFDTGITTTLTQEALVALADGGPSVRATSAITMRKFKRWHKRHPDWRVIPRADVVDPSAVPLKTYAMIEVATMTIGGHAVGPVWFTVLDNVDKYVSEMMATHVEGSLGDSALRSLRVTVDYPRSIAVFEKP